MADDGQHPGELDPPRDLADALDRVVASWLERCVVATAAPHHGGECPIELVDEARTMAERAAPAIMDDVRSFLAVDVDEQRGTPLSLLRAAVVHPTEVLGNAGVPQPARDEFAQRSFPDDVYDLAPASWRDVDESLHEPGIVWGAWKASVVLRRRRDEGLR